VEEDNISERILLFAAFEDKEIKVLDLSNTSGPKIAEFSFTEFLKSTEIEIKIKTIR
jgi:hypothetical protein